MSKGKRKKRVANEVEIPSYRGEDDIIGFASQDRILQNSVEFIVDILRREHFKGKCPFSNQKALNLDLYEINYKKGGSDQQPTVDMVVCLGEKHLLLVEAKLNVINVDKIAKTIFDKISHSKELLQGYCSSYVWVKQIPILLNDTGFEQNKNRLRRLIMAKTRDIIPLRVSEFYTTYFET